MLISLRGPQTPADIPPIWTLIKSIFEVLHARGRGPSTYRVRDLEMAIRAVQKRGLNVARVEIAQDGRIVIVAGEPTSMHTPNVADDWEDAR